MKRIKSFISMLLVMMFAISMMVTTPAYAESLSAADQNGYQEKIDSGYKRQIAGTLRDLFNNADKLNKQDSSEWKTKGLLSERVRKFVTGQAGSFGCTQSVSRLYGDILVEAGKMHFTKYKCSDYSKAEACGLHKVKIEWHFSNYNEMKTKSKKMGFLIVTRKQGKQYYVGKFNASQMTAVGGNKATYTFIDNYALADENNSYWICPYVVDSKNKLWVSSGSYSSATAQGRLPAPTGLKAYSVQGGVKLTWNTVKYADGYVIYGIVDGKPYGYVGMVSGRTNTTFVDTKASSSRNNYYWVIPYTKKSRAPMEMGKTSKYAYGKALQ